MVDIILTALHIQMLLNFNENWIIIERYRCIFICKIKTTSVNTFSIEYTVYSKPFQLYVPFQDQRWNELKAGRSMGVYMDMNKPTRSLTTFQKKAEQSEETVT